MIGNWDAFPEYVALGAIGAASIEWLKCYELKQKSEKSNYESLIKSFIYWAKFLLFLFASGFIAWAINENNPNATVWQVVISGAGANAFANKGIEAALSKEKLFAGNADKSAKVRIRDLF